ncbi:MAG: putative nucleic acid-binding protein contains domain [Actinomycetia bacterium]|nr:putative nucleic acid-binding protein contains domain [Actinomycetes bacterium]
MIVVDASVVVTAVAAVGPDGTLARHRLTGEHLHAPHLLDLEVASALRQLVGRRAIKAAAAATALDELTRLPLRRVPHVRLLPRCWELRHNLSTYDACYVALAEALRLPLLTADQRLARAPGIRCDVELLTS